jgi:hypothetical protein
MYERISDALHALNIVFQSLYSLALPIGFGALLSYLLTEYTSIGSWIWAVLLTIGTIIGFYSMVKYILTAAKNLEQLEKQREESRALKEEKERKRAELRRDLNTKENKGDNYKNADFTPKNDEIY